ncbi:uncharacterized protein Dwil_GK12016 [Drosophila willistoni]|uniref:Lipase domain-containing protein n=1 Tax=Drosophila willistoni TaxID=7260 RepID=B4N8A8_DROWI|nr:pancreatic triacylglycerol lipase [Drosophila willistoni]EDW81359.2 uncharacterized protein Dwil_GK12016 [Drosophila willistoni]
MSGEQINGENGWYVPHGGSFKWIDMEEGEKLLANGDPISTNAVDFYLHTKYNPISGQKIEPSSSSISGSYFNKSQGTRFFIHGWTSGHTDIKNTNFIKAWLCRGDYNIINVDWARARDDYVSSVLAIPGAGAKVGDMIKYLHESHGMSLNSLQVIGLSLGAHVSGYAGKTVGEGKIDTIVGLDPALPLFSYDKPAKRLNSGDAWYVESIQTSGGKLGFLKPIGKGSFYPNGGKKQPGCGRDTDGWCSHARSITYYTEAVNKDNFGTIKCYNYKAAVAKDCGSTYSGTRMGAVTNTYMVGYYYVPINSEAPFGMIN